MAGTESRGNIDVRKQAAKGAQIVRDAQGGTYTLFGVHLDGGLDQPVHAAQQNPGYVQVGGTAYKAPKLNAASLKVLQNEEESKARHALWRQHDAERKARLAKGYAALDRAVAAINRGIQAEDAKKHPLKAVHWNAKAGKAPWNPQDVAEVKDENGNVTTKGSKAGTEYADFKKKFEAWTKGLVVDPKTGKNSEGRMRYGDSGTMLQKYKDLGIVTYDRDGNQVVNWDKVTSQEQVDVLKGEMAKDDEFQGHMIAGQRERDAKIVSDARDYAKQNGITLPKDATDAQLLRTVFADKAKKAADAVQSGDLGAAGREYGSANIVDAVDLMHESIGVARDKAMLDHLEGDDVTVMKNDPETAKIGNDAMSAMKTAVQKAADDARDNALNAEGDISDVLAEQMQARNKVNESMRGNGGDVEGSNVTARRKLDDRQRDLDAQKVGKKTPTAEQKPEEGQA
jgi:hypothetical protein